MKCTVSGGNLKVLARAVLSLARIGEDLFVEPDTDCLTFKSVNSSRSACASITLKKQFFSVYKHDCHTTVASSQENSTGCKISMKSCLPIFRSPVMLDRKVESCTICLDENRDMLIFEMRFRHNIFKTYFLPIIECETLQVICTMNVCMNCLLAQVQIFSDAVNNFRNSQEEVTLTMSSQKMLICSYVDNCSKLSKSTQIVLDPAEFNKYSVTNDSSITFNLKEFRAILSFAEVTVETVEAKFSQAGKPVVFVVQHENVYEASFVLSTVTPYDTQKSTCQQIGVPNLNSPLAISPIPLSEERISPSTIKRNLVPLSNSVSKCSDSVEEHSSKVGLCITSENEKQFSGKQRSPSLISKVRCNRSIIRRVQSKQDEKRNEERNNSSTLPSFIEVNENVASQKYENQFLEDKEFLQEDHTRNDTTINKNFVAAQIHASSESFSCLKVRESDNDESSVNQQRFVHPPKRRKLCDMFDNSFDPFNVPAHNVILVEDSGDEER